jgi:two-component system, response regulator
MTAKVILLIEDNPDDAELAIRALEMGQVKSTVVRAHDGVEALDYLFGTGTHAARPGLMPDVVLLDLKLPRVDGLEVLRRVRADERTRYLPVVIMTSSRREQDIEAGYALGANSYVCKPVQFSQFVETANQLGIYWLTVNQPMRRS